MWKVQMEFIMQICNTSYKKSKPFRNTETVPKHTPESEELFTIVPVKPDNYNNRLEEKYNTRNGLTG